MNINQDHDVLLNRIHELETALQKAEERLARAPGLDPITKLPNKALFVDRLKQAVARAYRSNKLMSVLYLDVSYSRLVAAKFGDVAVHELLRDFTDRFLAAIRNVDTLACFSNHAFAVIMEDVKHIDTLNEILSKLVSNAEKDFYYDGYLIPIQTTIGASIFDGVKFRDDDLLGGARSALADAKRARDSSTIYG